MPVSGASAGVANASAAASAKNATAVATATGGAGGDAFNSGATGGAGASATGSASAIGVLTASASLTLYGGAGGYGYLGAAGGIGGAATADNVVSGSTRAGTLTLSEAAYGGAGGASNGGHGGSGGSANVAFTLDDATSASIDATIFAAGGSSISSQGLGGSATASVSVTGTATVSDQATANAGINANGATGSPPDATATAAATGANVAATAEATTYDRSSVAVIGNAIATASGNGANGTTGSVQAIAVSQNQSATQAILINATASGTVSRSATAVAEVLHGTVAPAFDDNVDAISTALSAPVANALAVTQVFAANPSISNAFGANPTILSVSEIGAGHANFGLDTETTTVSQTIDDTLSASATQGDLVIGLYGGTAIGEGVTDVRLTVMGLTGTLLYINYTGPDAAAEAVSAFDDQVHDLGAWPASTLLDLSVTLSVTTDALFEGFYGEFIVGSVPAADDFWGSEHLFHR
jgi:hypothetical protein